MTLVKNSPYTETPIRVPSKQGLMVISEMSTARIMRYLTYRHRVGLLLMGNMAFVAYLSWDKLLHIFF